MRDAYWARAVKSRPEPINLQPICLLAAAEGIIGPIPGFYMERAFAAADRRLTCVCYEGIVTQQDAALDRALLAYHNGDLEDAWVELGLLQESLEEREKVSVLLSRISLILGSNRWNIMYDRKT